MNSIPKSLLPVVCYAWPDQSLSSRTELLAEWGWQVQTECAPSSWEELWEWLDASSSPYDSDDLWTLGYVQAGGWQILLLARKSFGGLREIYQDFGFPVLEWTLKGNDADFDLDVIVEQNFFFAHVVRGRLDLNIEEVWGQIRQGSKAGGNGPLLSWDVPPTLWPHLRGMPRQFVAYGSLSAMLEALGVPAELRTIPSEPFLPTYLELKMKDRPR